MAKYTLDQYGNKFFADTVKDLRSQIGMGNSRVTKMYVDREDSTFHIGYVIGQHWLTTFVPFEQPA